MSFLFFEIFGDGYTSIPIFFSEPQVVGVNQLFDFLFDGFGVEGDIFF